MRLNGPITSTLCVCNVTTFCTSTHRIALQLFKVCFPSYDIRGCC